MHRRAAILAVGVIALVVAGSALAGKPSGSSGGGPKSSSIKLVTVAADGTRVAGGQPAFGDNITYEIATTATNEPYVETSCFQNGALVYKQSRGFFAEYYAGTQMFTLGPTTLWQGGGANCTARLIEWVNGNDRTLATSSFDVAG